MGGICCTNLCRGNKYGEGFKVGACHHACPMEGFDNCLGVGQIGDTSSSPLDRVCVALYDEDCI